MTGNFEIFLMRQRMMNEAEYSTERAKCMENSSIRLYSTKFGLPSSIRP